MWVLRAQLYEVVNSGRNKAKAGVDLCDYCWPGVPDLDILVSDSGPDGDE